MRRLEISEIESIEREEEEGLMCTVILSSAARPRLRTRLPLEEVEGKAGALLRAFLLKEYFRGAS